MTGKFLVLKDSSGEIKAGRPSARPRSRHTVGRLYQDRIAGTLAVMTASVGFFSLLLAMRGVGQACARVERAGYTARVKRLSQIGEEEMQQLRAACARWREGKVERGYSMALSRLGDDRDGQCVIVTAHRAGELAAVLHFMPWDQVGCRRI